MVRQTSASIFARAVVAALVLPVLAGVASATTMMKLDLAGLTQRADTVIAGHVTDSQAAWTSDHNAIYTDVTIVVERSLAGSFTAGQTVTVRSEGGVVDGIGMRVYGAAGFAKNEEVVVFLEQRAGHRYVVGMAQGKLIVTTDASGVKRLHRKLADVALLAGTDERRALATQGTVSHARVDLHARRAGHRSATPAHARAHQARSLMTSKLRLALLFLAVLCEARAHAYVRSRSSSGTPTHWAGDCVQVQPDSAGTPDLDDATTFSVIQTSMQAWRGATP